MFELVARIAKVNFFGGGGEGEQRVCGPMVGNQTWSFDARST